MENKEISVELRLVLAFALSFVILMGWRFLLPKPPAEPPQSKAPAAQAAAKPADATSAPQASATPAAQPIGEPKQAAAEQQITVESDLYQIVFSSRGGVAKSWSLRRYRDEKNNSLDVMDQDAAKQYGDPFAIWTADPALRQRLNEALFVPSATGNLKAPATLTFEYRNDHIAARKEITFNAKDYIVEVKTDVFADDKPVSHQIAWRGGFGDAHDIGMRGNQIDVFYRDPQKVSRLAPGDVKNGDMSASGMLEFAGIEDRFFTAAFLPTAGPLRVTAFRNDVTVPKESKPRQSVGMAVGSMDAPQNHMRLFVGPKDTELMATIQPRLPELVDYGWFAFVAKPLFLAMRWMHDHIVANYGWAIILLTVLINFALFPIKLKGMKSQIQLQKIQPQMKAIQEKYKQYKMKDPRKQEMQKEIMELQSKHGVNPLGGCLPMLVQIPFLYGFYKVLVVSIEMRHAPWILWIHDLSAPEQLTIRVLPIAM